MLTRCIPWPELASRVIFLSKTLQFWKNQNNTWEWRVEVSKQGMEMKIQTTVNYLNTLARNTECKETQAQKPSAQLWPHQQARVPGAPKPAASEVCLALAAVGHCWARGGSHQQQGWSPGPPQRRQPRGWTVEREQWGARLVLMEICFAVQFWNHLEDVLEQACSFEITGCQQTSVFLTE